MVLLVGSTQTGQYHADAYNHRICKEEANIIRSVVVQQAYAIVVTISFHIFQEKRN